MASKVNPTPVLKGKDAEKFYDELSRPSTLEEVESLKKADKIFQKIKFIR
jgi:hypothetical protein